MVNRRWIQRAAAGVALASTLMIGVGCDAIINIPDRKLGDHLTCTDSKCACEDGFGDCDGDPANGCEADLTKAPNCGGCGNTCAHGTCGGTQCSCSPGFSDCDGDPKNGCEADLAADPRQCGVCGHDCEGGDCMDAHCAPYSLATYAFAYSIELYKSSLVVAACQGGSDLSVVELPVDGGTPIGVTDATVMDCAVFQAISGDTLYWSGKTQIYSSSLTTPGAPMSLINPATAGFIGVTAANLYWIETNMATMTAQLRRRPLAGGAATTLSTGKVTMAFETGGRIYWADPMGIRSINDSETMPTLVSSEIATAITVDGNSIYAQVDAGIESIPLAGGSPTMLVPDASTYAMKSDGAGLYYFDFMAGTLSVLPLSGGEPRILASGLQAPTSEALAFDDKAVYWIANNTVYKMVR